ncbi:adenylosuccinate synthase [Vibrio cholerae]|uniref:Adenylosuccinate synthetase n=4 Tax=Vibrio cholerae TaxID=666 RepID=A0ZPL4_VIBCL|nr:adenylosuccinate synthase [Vibrio cholerae]EEO02249.1 adenylosuccinate synthetase [Vibrio cholerae VL426]EGR1263688.1 adenylosuccinate synthase [Vibrio cholerae]EGR1859487.1 adenylosuccinate synthase [Vibrio cholerae]EHB5526752.1 adenylosuccinate synthase [Vibrio cholerae]EJL6262175.1 adenylosuccinate synthase [Vibrio cholerae]
MIKAIVGLQMGDEGKGKFVDLLAQQYRHIVRFNGGANAGHSVVFNEQRMAFSQIPATIRNGKCLYISQGALISLERLLQEIEFIKDHCPDTQLFIDPRCHIVLPIHAALNQASEQYKGVHKIGSVGVGVGACYEDKSNRLGIRLQDTLNESVLRHKLTLLWEIREKQIESVFEGRLHLNFEQQVQYILRLGKQLEPYFCFTNQVISRLLQRGESMLLESSQATFLDNSFGTYPYTVAYSTLIQSCFASIGIPAQTLQVLGVMKAYMIRVGNGPFPTELDGDIAQYIRVKGNEFGTVSQRPRRCGWLDLALVEQAIHLNGVKEVAITNLDVLGGMDEVWVCNGYLLHGKKVCTDEALLHFDQVEPIYTKFQGWPRLPNGILKLSDLPKELLHYLAYIQSYISAPIRYISYGAEREYTIHIEPNGFSQIILAESEEYA